MLSHRRTQHVPAHLLGSRGLDDECMHRTLEGEGLVLQVISNLLDADECYAARCHRVLGWERVSRIFTTEQRTVRALRRLRGLVDDLAQERAVSAGELTVGRLAESRGRCETYTSSFSFCKSISGRRCARSSFTRPPPLHAPEALRSSRASAMAGTARNQISRQNVPQHSAAVRRDSGTGSAQTHVPDLSNTRWVGLELESCTYHKNACLDTLH